MGTNANAILVVPNDGDPVNLVDNAQPTTTTGTPVYATGVRRTARSYTVDNNPDGDRDIWTVPAFDPANCTMHCTFRTTQAFTSALNAEYYLMSITGGGISLEGIRLILNYADAAGHNGFEVEIRNTTQSRLTLNDMDLADDSTHSLGVVIKTDAANSERTLAIYLDGRYIRGTTYLATDLPTDATSVIVGNASAGGPVTAAQCIIEDVLVYNEALDGDAMFDLHTNGLNTACVNNTRTYEDQKSVRNYTRTTTSSGIVPRWYDAIAGRMWGYSVADSDQLHYSDDEGENWTLFNDFNNGLVIRGIIVWDGNVYVSQPGTLQRSSKTTASFSEVLAMAGADSYLLNWCFALNSDESLLAVCEYEGQPATNPNRVLTSPDGTTWTVRKSLTGSEEHWHSVHFDADDNLYATVGDTADATYVSSPANYSSWTTITTAAEEQSIQMVSLADGRLILASDSASGRALLRQYEPDYAGHAYTLSNSKWSRLIPMTGNRLANVFALFQSRNGTVWTFGHAEGEVNRRSTVWLMHPTSRAPVLAEDLGAVTLPGVNAFVETENYIWLDESRWSKNAIVDLGTPSSTLRRVLTQARLDRIRPKQRRRDDADDAE